MNAAVRSRFLVLHDYGSGGTWWWIIAVDSEEILETFANVEVMTSPEHLAVVADWDLPEVDVTGPYPPGLDGLAAKRAEQRTRPGYGVLAGRGRPVHLRWEETSTGVTWCTEFAPSGRRTRQVRINADGVARAFTEWTIDVPEDLRDPALLPLEITAAEFEALWATCR